MKILSLTLVSLFTLSLATHAQTDSSRLMTLATGIEKLATRRPIEKVYLQLNKPAYNLGDTIWFKAYVTVGTHHQPSALSGVLYVDLLDGNNRAVKSLQLNNK